jgi:dolichyl-diphosphooligosaccharide--protein glycosyltransferase
VPEGEVNGDADGEISVELERTEQELTLGGGGDSGGETQSLQEPTVSGDAARAA